MKNIITIGGATQDIFIYTKPDDIVREEHKGSSFLLFEEGRKIEVQKLHYATGGGATNAAVTLKLLEHHVTPICKIANDTAGDFVIHDLQQRGITTRLIKVSSEAPTATSYILPSSSGNRTILAYRGANGMLAQEDIPFDALQKSDGIYVAPLSGSSSSLLPEIAQFAQKNRIFIAVNPSNHQLQYGAQDLQKALPFIDLLILNEHEAKMLHISLEETKPFNISEFCHTILQRGTKMVAVTSGIKGVHVAQRTTDGKIDAFFQKAIPVDVVNTVGAGDAFSACFFGMLMHGYTIEKALKFGVMNSASLLTGQDAKDKLLTRAELEAQLK